MDDREDALDRAITIGGTTPEILTRAELFYKFLRGELASRLVLHLGPLVDQNTRAPQGPILGVVPMAQLHDDQQFTVTVEAKDAKGFDVADTLTASSADETVATVAADADGVNFTVVAGVPGSTVVTFTDGNLTANLAVDVVAGNVALLQLNVGDPIPQPV